jgi:hypothetical protein
MLRHVNSFVSSGPRGLNFFDSLKKHMVGTRRSSHVATYLNQFQDEITELYVDDYKQYLVDIGIKSPHSNPMPLNAYYRQRICVWFHSNDDTVLPNGLTRTLLNERKTMVNNLITGGGGIEEEDQDSDDYAAHRAAAMKAFEQKKKQRNM